MTNTNNSSGWEVAGAKKLAAVKKTTQPNGKAKTNGKLTKEEAEKFPKLETRPPLKPDSTIYDLIRESDDDDDYKEINNNNVKAKKAASSTVTNGTVFGSVQNKVESPKKAPRKQPEPVNLLQSNILTNQKKKIASVTGPKNVESDLQNALNELKVDEFDIEYNISSNLFSNNFLLVSQHLAAYLNMKLNNIAEFEPSSSHENESTFPMSKLDKNVLKFYNTLISKLSRNDIESLYEYCFKELFNDKMQSLHGFKLVLQLAVKHMPNMSVNNKYYDIINNNKHKHQRCLVALWSLAQIGYYNLSNGIKIWFDSMLPFMNIKGCTNFVITYLQSVFQHHKIDGKTKLSEQSITLDQYLKLYDLVNDKSLNLPKEVAQKFKTSFDTLRVLYVQEFVKNTSHFENVFRELPSENIPKQTEFLDLLSQALLKNKESFNKLKQIYSKNLAQTLTLFEYLSVNHMKTLKSVKEMKETIKYVFEQTTLSLSKQNPSSKEASTGAKSYFYNRNKSNKSSQSELDITKKLNKLTQQLIKQYFKRTSILSMVLRSLLFTAIAVGIFFYWDATQNKSIYTNSVEKQLEKYGLLETTLKLVESTKKLLFTIKKLINYYVPIWYNKANETVVPVIQRGWNVTKEYFSIVWIKLEPFRASVTLYTNQGIEFINANFPILVKNLVSVFRLAINYTTTIINFVLHYCSQAVDFIGTKLIGWNKGELEKIFLDAFKFLLESLNQLLQKINTYLNQK